jgi:hypothetical protein
LFSTSCLGDSASKSRKAHSAGFSSAELEAHTRGLVWMDKTWVAPSHVWIRQLINHSNYIILYYINQLSGLTFYIHNKAFVFLERHLLLPLKVLYFVYLVNTRQKSRLTTFFFFKKIKIYIYILLFKLTTFKQALKPMYSFF